MHSKLGFISLLCILCLTCLHLQPGSTSSLKKVHQDDDYPAKERLTMEEITSPSSPYIHQVKKKSLDTWPYQDLLDLNELIKLGHGNLLLLHRTKRQAPAPDPVSAKQDDSKSAGSPYTPVLPFMEEDATKKYDEGDCLPSDEIAVIFRSDLDPEDKRRMVLSKTCNPKLGLECVPVESKKGVYVNKCRCNTVYGPSPVLVSTKHGKKCHIPAGKGWASECNAKKSTEYGYPQPFGDPPGANAEAAVQTDAYNSKDGRENRTEYIRWNQIKPECTPNSECRERGTFVGQRCVCRKGSHNNVTLGTCSEATILERGYLMGLIGITGGVVMAWWGF